MNFGESVFTLSGSVKKHGAAHDYIISPSK